MGGGFLGATRLRQEISSQASEPSESSHGMRLMNPSQIDESIELLDTQVFSGSVKSGVRSLEIS